MRTPDKLSEDIAELVEKVLAEASMVTANSLGLDGRCGEVYVLDDCLAVDKDHRQRLDYYGGFEYVDPEYVKVFGNMVFYSDEDPRVSAALDCLDNLDEEGEYRG